MLLSNTNLVSSTSTSSRPVTSTDQKTATEPESKETSNFEDAVLWFQTQNLQVDEVAQVDLAVHAELTDTSVEATNLISTDTTTLDEPTFSPHGRPARASTPLEKMATNSNNDQQTLNLESADALKPFSTTQLESFDDLEASAAELEELITPKEMTSEPSKSSVNKTPQASEQSDFTADQFEVEHRLDSTNDIPSNEGSASVIEMSDQQSELLKPQPSQPIKSATTQLAEQSLAQISNQANTKDSSFTVRLDPPELGEVVVNLKKSEGGIVMRIAAVEKSTQTLLELNQFDLSQAMTENGQDVTMEFTSQSDMTDSQSRFHEREANSRPKQFDSIEAEPQEPLSRYIVATSQSQHDFTA